MKSIDGSTPLRFHLSKAQAQLEKQFFVTLSDFEPITDEVRKAVREAGDLSRFPQLAAL